VSSRPAWGSCQSSSGFEAPGGIRLGGKSRVSRSRAASHPGSLDSHCTFEGDINRGASMEDACGAPHGIHTRCVQHARVRHSRTHSGPATGRAAQRLRCVRHAGALVRVARTYSTEDSSQSPPIRLPGASANLGQWAAWNRAGPGTYESARERGQLASSAAEGLGHRHGGRRRLGHVRWQPGHGELHAVQRRL
jgi:hypothetical protein